MPAKSMTLFTNRNCAIFDEKGEQMADYQSAISCHEVKPEIALKITLEAEYFFISKWQAWRHAITRTEMQYLLGLRTREMDLQETS